MTKGMAAIFTVIFLAASMVIIYQYEITSMSSTSQGVNLTTAPQEVQDAYAASTHTTITSIAVSHYTILFLGIAAVLISLASIILMAKANQGKVKM